MKTLANRNHNTANDNISHDAGTSTSSNTIPVDVSTNNGNATHDNDACSKTAQATT